MGIGIWAPSLSSCVILGELLQSSKPSSFRSCMWNLMINPLWVHERGRRPSVVILLITDTVAWLLYDCFWHAKLPVFFFWNSEPRSAQSGVAWLWCSPLLAPLCVHHFLGPLKTYLEATGCVSGLILQVSHGVSPGLLKFEGTQQITCLFSA